jgi:hypothetical protein
MARNLTTGHGRRGAIRGRYQFRLPNGRYAKVDRTTGRVLSVKADRKPYKGVVIVAAPARMPRRAGERRTLPALTARPTRRAPSTVPATGGMVIELRPEAGDDIRIAA